MRIRGDGSIQSSATPTHQNIGRQEDYAIYRCMVTSVIYIDNPLNITANGQNPRVLYDVVVLGGFASGQVISNCRLSSDFGGNSSFWERTLRASEKDVSKTRLSDCDGDVVFVQFVQGHTGYPVIMALDNGIMTSGILGATLELGPRSLRQFNGVQESINKDGELELQVKGGVAIPEKGSFKPAEAPALFTSKVDKTEKYTRTFKSGLKVEEDGKGDKITHTFKGGLKVTTDGKNDSVKIVTKGGATASVDGKTGEIALKDNGTGALKIKESKVALGASSAELLQEFSDTLQKFITFMQNIDALHTHTGNLGYPTSLPTETAQFIQLATDLTAIKSKVDGIKGTL